MARYRVPVNGEPIELDIDGGPSDKDWIEKVNHAVADYQATSKLDLAYQDVVPPIANALDRMLGNQEPSIPGAAMGRMGNALAHGVGGFVGAIPSLLGLGLDAAQATDPMNPPGVPGGASTGGPIQDALRSVGPAVTAGLGGTPGATTGEKFINQAAEIGGSVLAPGMGLSGNAIAKEVLKSPSISALGANLSKLGLDNLFKLDMMIQAGGQVGQAGLARIVPAEPGTPEAQLRDMAGQLIGSLGVAGAAQATGAAKAFLGTTPEKAVTREDLPQIQQMVDASLAGSKENARALATDLEKPYVALKAETMSLKKPSAPVAADTMRDSLKAIDDSLNAKARVVYANIDPEGKLMGGIDPLIKTLYENSSGKGLPRNLEMMAKARGWQREASVAERPESTPDVFRQWLNSFAGYRELPLSDLMTMRRELRDAAIEAQANTPAPNRLMVKRLWDARDVVDKIIDDIPNQTSDPTAAQAVAALRDANEWYRPRAQAIKEGYAADIMRHGPRGEEFKTGADTAADKVLDNVDAARAFKRIGEVFQQENPDEVASAVNALTDYAKRRFIAGTGDALDNTFTRDRAESFVRKPGLTEELPGLQQQLRDAARGADTAANLRNLGDKGITRTEYDKTAAHFRMDESPDQFASRVLAEDDIPQGEIENALQKIGPDKQAKRGLQRSIIDELHSKAVGVEALKLGEAPYQGQALEAQLDNYGKGLVDSGLFTKEDLQRAYTMAEAYKIVDGLPVTKRSAGAPGFGETAGTLAAVTEAAFGISKIFQVVGARPSQMWGAWRLSDAARRLVGGKISLLTQDEARGLMREAMVDPDAFAALKSLGSVDTPRVTANLLKRYAPIAAARMALNIGGQDGGQSVLPRPSPSPAPAR